MTDSATPAETPKTLDATPCAASPRGGMSTSRVCADSSSIIGRR